MERTHGEELLSAHEGDVVSLATWRDVSLECRRAAQDLFDNGHWRSSANRSYYAAYCAITARLVEAGAQFPYGWNNPHHAHLPSLIDGKLNYLAIDVRQQLKKRIRTLANIRVTADYRPGRSVDGSIAGDAIRDAYYVLRKLEVIE